MVESGMTPKMAETAAERQAYASPRRQLLRGLGEWRMILYATLLIVTMLVRPQGLLGQRELVPRAWLRRREA